MKNATNIHNESQYLHPDVIIKILIMLNAVIFMIGAVFWIYFPHLKLR